MAPIRNKEVDDDLKKTKYHLIISNTPLDVNGSVKYHCEQLQLVWEIILSNELWIRASP